MSNTDDIIVEKSVRFEALQQLREVQADLTRLNFLDVISMMKEENPKRKEILKFEDDLNDLTTRIGTFIQTAKNDVDYQPSDEELEDTEDEDNKDAKTDDKKTEKPKEDKKDKTDERVITVIDSTISTFDRID